MDACVGAPATRALRELGVDVASVREIRYDLDDPAILDLACREGRILITTDSDFGKLVFADGRPHVGVLFVRMGNSSGRERAEAIVRIVQEQAGTLAGTFCTFEKGHLRVGWAEDELP